MTTIQGKIAIILDLMSCLLNLPVENKIGEEQQSLIISSR